MTDYLYERPPLVEVIAELQWEISPVRSIPVPNAGIDPFYSDTAAAVKTNTHIADFKHHESLAPPDVPIELFAYQPLIRFRKASNTWPLYQIGPGLWSTNITPPYNGWNAFKPTLRNGLHALSESFPAFSKTFKLKKAELRYLDAFALAPTGLTYSEFLQKFFAFNITVPPPIITSAGGPTNVAFQGEFSFPVEGQPNCFGLIKLMPGAVRGQRSAILEFGARFTGPLPSPDQEALISCFDLLHGFVRNWFEDVINDELRESFGARREI